MFHQVHEGLRNCVNSPLIMVLKCHLNFELIFFIIFFPHLERVEEVGEVHGVLHALHQQMGRVHGQVGKRVVALNSKIGKVNLLLNIMITLKRLDLTWFD